jgi:hypothetical protein
MGPENGTNESCLAFVGRLKGQARPATDQHFRNYNNYIFFHFNLLIHFFNQKLLESCLDDGATNGKSTSILKHKEGLYDSMET